MEKRVENKEGGFLKLVILIIVALIIMKYLHISLSDILNWFKTLFKSVL